MLNYIILTTYSSHLYSMWDFTYTCNSTISLSHVSLCLFVGFKISAWAMNKFYLLSLTLRVFHFTSALSMDLHVSTPHIFYPPWEPRTSSLSRTIGNNTHLLCLFQDLLCGLYGLAWCNILSPLQLRKEPTPLYL